MNIDDEWDDSGLVEPEPAKRRGNPDLRAQIGIRRTLTDILPARSVVYRITNEAVAPASCRTRVARMRWHQVRKLSSVVPGIPDLCALVPDPPRALFFEIKSKDGRVDPRQLEMHQHLRALGFHVAVVRTPAEAIEAVRAAGITPRASRLDP